jgi:hypothetical protein
MAKHYYYIGAVIIASILLLFSQAPFNLSFLAFCGFPLFLLVLEKQKNILGSIAYSGLFAFLYFGVTISWLWSIYPLDNLGIQSHFISFSITGLIWLITTLALTLPWLGFGWYYQTILRKIDLHNILSVITTSTLFVIIFLIDSFMVSLIWYGGHGGLEAFFVYGNPVYSLHQSALALWLVSYIGEYGLLFIIASISVSILRLTHQIHIKRRNKKDIVHVFFVLCSVILFLKT